MTTVVTDKVADVVAKINSGATELVISSTHKKTYAHTYILLFDMFVKTY